MERSPKRVSLGCQAFEFGPGLVEHTPDIVPGRGQRVLGLPEVVRGKEVKGVNRFLAVTQSAGGAHLSGQYQKVATGLQQDAADVCSGGRDNPARFVVRSGEDFFAHPRQIARLFTPGLALSPIVVDQRRNLADWSGLLILRVVWVHSGGVNSFRDLGH
jgi:hypothetical protein